MTVPNAELLRVAVSHCLSRAGLDRPGHRYRQWVELSVRDHVLSLRHVGTQTQSRLTFPIDSPDCDPATVELLLLQKSVAAGKQEPIELSLSGSTMSVAYGTVVATLPFAGGTVPTRDALDEASWTSIPLPQAELLPVLSQWALSDRSTIPALHVCRHHADSVWAIHRTGLLRCQSSPLPESSEVSHLVVPAGCWAGWRTPTRYGVTSQHLRVSTTIEVRAVDKHAPPLTLGVDMWIPRLDVPFPPIGPLLHMTGILWHGPRHELMHATHAVAALTDHSLNAVMIRVDGKGTATVCTPPTRKTQRAEARCPMEGPAAVTTLSARQLSTVLGALTTEQVQWCILPTGPVRLSAPDQSLIAILSPVTL